MTHDNPFMPPREAVQWDCTECAAGLWLTELAAAKGCPVNHPELCGGKLTKRAGTRISRPVGVEVDNQCG